MKATILTVSDKGSRGEREDNGGPLRRQWLAERGVAKIKGDSADIGRQR